MLEQHDPRTATPPTAASAWLVQLLIFVLTVVALAYDQLHLLHTPGGHESPGQALAFLAWLIGASVGGIIVHELGHLAVALLVRLPVVHVALLPSGGRPAHVRFVLNLNTNLLPTRAILIALAGPLVNLASAAEFLDLADRPATSPEWHSLLLAAAIMSASLGVRNLIPTGPVRGTRLDGTQAALWAFRPARMRRELIMRHQAKLLASYTATLRRGKVPDLNVLRKMADSSDPEFAARAAPVLLNASVRAGEAEFANDSARLHAATRNPHLTAAAAADLAGRLAWHESIALIRDTVRARSNSVNPDRLARTAKAAEFAFARDPARPVVRYALAMVRVLQEQPKAARDLLMMVDHDALTGPDRGNTLAVRALAEIDLGDLPQARRLIEAARREDARTAPLLTIVERVLTAHENRQDGLSAEP